MADRVLWTSTNRFAKFVWEASPKLVSVLVFLRLIRGLTPFATLWIGKLIVDSVVAAKVSGSNWHSIAALVVLELVLVAASDLTSRIASLVEANLGDLVAHEVSLRLMRQAAVIDFSTFEDAGFADQLERARQAAGRSQLLGRLLGLLQGVVTLTSLTLALLALNPLLVALLVFTAVPSAVGETRFASHRYLLMFRWTRARDEHLITCATSHQARRLLGSKST